MQAVRLIAEGRAPRLPQPEEGATYEGIQKKETAKVSAWALPSLKPACAGLGCRGRPGKAGAGAGWPGCDCLRPDERAAQVGEHEQSHGGGGGWHLEWQGAGRLAPPCSSLGRMGRQGPGGRAGAEVCERSAIVPQVLEMRLERESVPWSCRREGSLGGPLGCISTQGLWAP